MNDRINLIVIEGHDRTGKGELMRSLKNDDRFVIYEQPETEDQDTDYKDPSKFEPFMVKWIRKVLDDLYTIHRGNPNKIIVMTRLIYTDNVFSQLYHRKPIVKNYYEREIETNFNIYTIFMFWVDYQEYLNRMKRIGGKVQFTKDELDEILKLYMKEILNNAESKPISSNNSMSSIFEVKDEMTPDYVLNWFYKEFDQYIDFYFKNQKLFDEKNIKK